MPELPEVELVAQALREFIVGRSWTCATILRPRLLPDSTPERFAERCRGVSVVDVRRRGKYIIIELDNGFALLVHLRMSGRLLILPPDRPLPKFTHAIFEMDDGRRFIFSDQRHFGMMKLVAADQLAQEFQKLAPEPFSEDFSAEYLRTTLARSQRTLKETLLDQSKVVGLGNIYAAEAMFLARINPFIKAARVSPRRVSRLHCAILEVLAESIAYGSTLNVDPTNIDGSYYGGAYEGRWRVYGREGERCFVCGALIKRAAQAGRSTYFCPRCQKR
ncbi:bifunctional DNA-formamidopyrimidine glycosylase/DNA-(apurinic or apyrimidinic site) lyase [Pyrinomonas sp.]|uniref:bifunctional DNA-formamidopyrimidine glycosylase/DNA-(apurinic or apyrimidinic site) lyase n=1 Tax=Pyrinomonas sp. TaxID=2080306 RepID=UPI0033315ECD